MQTHHDKHRNKQYKSIEKLYCNINQCEYGGRSNRENRAKYLTLIFVTEQYYVNQLNHMRLIYTLSLIHRIFCYHIGEYASLMNALTKLHCKIHNQQPTLHLQHLSKMNRC